MKLVFTYYNSQDMKSSWDLGLRAKLLVFNPIMILYFQVFFLCLVCNASFVHQRQATYVFYTAQTWSNYLIRSLVAHSSEYEIQRALRIF